MLAGTECDGALQPLGRFLVGDDEGCGAVRDQRAVGAPQRRRHIGVLLGNDVAELEAEVPAHLGVGVRDAILVVLRGDAGKLLAAVAVALEIALGNPPEHAREAAFDVGLLLPVRGAQEDIAGLGDGLGRHLLGADDQGNAPPAALDEVQGRVEGSRSRRTRVLDACCRNVSQSRLVERNLRGLEALLGEAVVHDADIDAVDIPGSDPGMSESLARNPRHQALDVRILELAERRMGPTDDGSACHITISAYDRETMLS